MNNHHIRPRKLVPVQDISWLLFYHTLRSFQPLPLLIMETIMSLFVQQISLGVSIVFVSNPSSPIFSWPDFNSGYCPTYHSSETAFLKITLSIHVAKHNGQILVVILTGLSSNINLVSRTLPCSEIPTKKHHLLRFQNPRVAGVLPGLRLSISWLWTKYISW